MNEIKMNYMKPEMDVCFWMAVEVVGTSDGIYDEMDDGRYEEITF